MPNPASDQPVSDPKTTALLVRMSKADKDTFAAAAAKGDTFAAELLRRGGLKEAAKILKRKRAK